MNSQTNQSIIALVMDTLTGGYLLSDPSLRINPEEFLNYLTMMVEPNDFSFTDLKERLIRHNVPLYSGQSLFSALLPANFYYDHAGVSIRDGILVRGRLSKKSMGNSPNSIIQVMWNGYGADRLGRFITDAYRIIDRWLSSQGFSIGIDDCIIDKPLKERQIRDSIRKKTVERLQELSEPLLDPTAETERQNQIAKILKQEERDIRAAIVSAEQRIQAELEKARVKVRALGDEPETDPLAEERRQKQISIITNDTQKNIGKAIVEEYLEPQNAFHVMIQSGAKGNLGNIAQIAGALGQQYLMGERIKGGLATASGEGQRTLPYFPNDVDIESRGFVVNNFLKGLNPAEYFFTLVAGRNSLIDTGLRTSDSGAIHHQIVKVMEDMKLAYDGSVRNAGGKIFQFAYGEDNFDPRTLFRTKTPFGDLVSFMDVNTTIGQINSKFGFY